MTTPQKFQTGIGVSTEESITLLGNDLASEILGKVSFGDLAFWLINKRRPTADELVMFEAVLASLADHGLTPTVIASRLTFSSAPDSLQGALAAGILGGGSRFLGVTEDCALFLRQHLDALTEIPATDEGWDEVAKKVVTGTRESKKFIPGLGHPVHKVQDPRTPVLFALAHKHKTFGNQLSLFEAIGRVHPQILNKTLPLNGAGVCGAVLADLGLPMGVLRGVALLARCAGLLGHLVEEQENPIGIDVYMSVDRNIDYQPPTA